MTMTEAALAPHTLYLNCKCRRCKVISIGKYEVQSKSCKKNDRFVVVEQDTQAYIHMDALHMPEATAVALATLLHEKPDMPVNLAIIKVNNP